MMQHLWGKRGPSEDAVLALPRPSSEEGRAGCRRSRSASGPGFLGDGLGSRAGRRAHGQGTRCFPARPALALF